MNLNGADLRISGYASLFGQTDLGGDRIKAGAFSASILQFKDGRLPMLFGHETANPIGVWDRITEDATGLFVSGRVISGTAQSDRAIRLIREGALSGLSIGYRVKRQIQQPLQHPLQQAAGRILTELDLWEVSVVAFPMQRTARITQIDDTSNSFSTSHPQPQRSIA